MKRAGLLIVAMIASVSSVCSQNVDDALRYSQIFYNGSARFNAMGGAFTALGGDLSSLSQNPAGLGVFRTSEISVSPQLFHFKSTSDYNDSRTEDYFSDFNLGQGGIVLNLKNNQSGSGLVTLNFGYSYSRTNNLDQSIKIQGHNENSSLVGYWRKISDGIIDTGLYDEVPDAYLGWYTGLLDTLAGFRDAYGTVYDNYGRNTTDYSNQLTRIITNSGYTGEHSIAIGGNYSNRLYFGVSLAITRLSYESRYEHAESSDSTLASGFEDFNYTFFYRDNGTGYALKFGFIYKPIEPLRIGFAFHTPTYFTINEYVNDNIVTNINNSPFPGHQQNNASWYSYHLTTPFRTSLGAAYQIGKLGVVSAEGEYAGYGMARFSTTANDDYDYTRKNDAIKGSLKNAFNYRFGAEARVNSRLYFRGGYGYYGKTYATGDVNENICYNSYSAGAGFREQNIYVDFGYTRITSPQKYILYEYYDDYLGKLVSSSSNMNLNRNIFAVTFGYKFGY